MAVHHLKLSGAACYSIVSKDDMSGAFVEALARTMKLSENNEGGRKILVYVQEKVFAFPRIVLPDNSCDPIVCPVRTASNPELFTAQVKKIAHAVAMDVIGKGGALVHGALCSLRGSGAILAGPGGIGKTTASNRLRAPWISHSDDAALIVPDGSGGFNAHPWPTWSRFFRGGSEGIWEVETSIPLKALFFLTKSKTDSIEKLDAYKAKSMLLDTIEHVMRSERIRGKHGRDLTLKCVKNADRMASVLPVFKLGVSLQGEFWKEMEKVMPKADSAAKHRPIACPCSDDNNRTWQHKIYRGTSMNPTFFEPELLKVVPYAGTEPKKGDIICYRPDHKDQYVVHRIIAVNGSNIKTQGDNSASPDNYIVRKDQVIGRVVASRKGNKTRTIPRGWLGVSSMHFCRIRMKLRRFTAKFLLKFYRCLAASGLFRKLKAGHMVFKVAIFERYSAKYLKLILNGRTVGAFDFSRMGWKIRRPYRLFVEVEKLPVLEDPYLL